MNASCPQLSDGRQLVHESRCGVAAIITLADPPDNGISDALLADLAAVCARIAIDDEVRAVVVWGGAVTFSGGSDLRRMVSMSPSEAAERSRRGQLGVSAIAAMGKPTVAAIAGSAVGGGLELALCADHRIATRSAELGLPEVRNGRMPGAGGTQLLPRLIGLSNALDLICSGRLIGADVAARIGLVDQVVQPDELLDAALRWAQRFGDLAPAAVRAARAAVHLTSRLPLDAGLEQESLLYGDLYAGEASVRQLAHVQASLTRQPDERREQ